VSALDNKKDRRTALIKQKSFCVSYIHGYSKNNDARVVRTRKRLDMALVELLHRRAYGNIRVSDIAKRGGVGRATFYAHYSSKDELLRSQFERIVAPMLAITPNDACLLDISAFLAHVKGMPRIYKALVGAEAGASPRIMRDCFEKRVRQALDLRDGNSHDDRFALQRTIVVRTLASALLVAVECWAENNMSQPPQEVQAIFRKLVGSALTAWRAPA
jgi:AcrR family transcriptional regulator